jgi:hypothetical protein
VDAYEFTDGITPTDVGFISTIPGVRHVARLLTGGYDWLLFIEREEDDYLEGLAATFDAVRSQIGASASEKGVALTLGPRPGGGAPLGPTRWLKVTRWLGYCRVIVSPGHTAVDVLNRIGEDHSVNGYQGGATVAGDFDILIELGFESRSELEERKEAVRGIEGVQAVKASLSPYAPEPSEE